MEIYSVDTFHCFAFYSNLIDNKCLVLHLLSPATINISNSENLLGTKIEYLRYKEKLFTILYNIVANNE